MFTLDRDVKFNQNPLIDLEKTPWTDRRRDGFNLPIKRQFVFMGN
jgi:hypothetical protein